MSVPTSSTDSDLAFMLGRIQGDVKHILTAIADNHNEFGVISQKFDRVDKRLDEVEKFNVKVITIATILISTGTVVLNAGLKYFM